MIKCEMVEGCGRLVFAARPIKGGEVIFREEAYVACPNYVAWKSSICICCSAHCASRHVESCPECGSLYCSEACFAAHKEKHIDSGECSVLAFTKCAYGCVPHEDFDTYQVVCLIIDKCVRENKAERLTRTSPKNLAFETVGFGSEVVSPVQFLNGLHEGLTCVSTYDHVECLATNVSHTLPEVVSDFSALYDSYMKLLNKKKNRELASKTLLTANISRDVFVGLCTAFLCNGFGVWDAEGRKKSVAVYPQSSYFNHSCAPNLGRRNLPFSRTIEFFAARDIEAGEPLCITYVALKLTTVERRMKLKDTYSFDCICQRCLSNDDDDNSFSSRFFPVLCDTCSEKILQPIGNGKYLCPCCNRVQKAH